MLSNLLWVIANTVTRINHWMHWLPFNFTTTLNLKLWLNFKRRDKNSVQLMALS